VLVAVIGTIDGSTGDGSTGDGSTGDGSTCQLPAKMAGIQ
jgi:hypothetical protein